MNLATYRAEVKERFGVPALDTSISDTNLDRAINAGLKHIANTANWPWLYTEVDVALPAGSLSFLPPPDWVKTVSVGEGGRYLSQGAAGWSVRGDRLYLPSGIEGARTITHGYFRSEPALILDTDAPLLPDTYSDWLINESCVRLALRTNNTDRLVQYKEEAAVSKQSTIDNVRKTVGLPQIRRTRPSVWQDI